MMPGDKVTQRYCILCENVIDHFLVDPNINKPKYCPHCRSYNRTRLTYYHLEQYGLLQRPELNVLHVAPHASIENKLRGIFGERYVTCDLVRMDVDYRQDLTAMTFADNEFDLIIMNHVLEHIDADEKALKELHRILAVGGALHLMVQINRSNPHSRYHPAEQRKPPAEFSPQDHIREYAWDVVPKLEQCGFSVNVIEYSKLLSKELRDYHGFKRDVILWCEKR